MEPVYYIFHGHSGQEPALVFRNNEQGGLFYSAGPHTGTGVPQPTQEKLGRGFGKIEMNGLEG